MPETSAYPQWADSSSSLSDVSSLGGLPEDFVLAPPPLFYGAYTSPNHYNTGYGAHRSYTHGLAGPSYTTDFQLTPLSADFIDPSLASSPQIFMPSALALDAAPLVPLDFLSPLEYASNLAAGGLDAGLGALNTGVYGFEASMLGLGLGYGTSIPAPYYNYDGPALGFCWL